MDVSAQRPTTVPSNDIDSSEAVVSDRFSNTSTKKSSKPNDSFSEISSNKNTSETVSSKKENVSSKVVNDNSIVTTTSNESEDVSSENEMSEPKNKPPYLLVGIIAAVMVVVAAIISILIKIKK